MHCELRHPAKGLCANNMLLSLFVLPRDPISIPSHKTKGYVTSFLSKNLSFDWSSLWCYIQFAVPNKRKKYKKHLKLKIRFLLFQRIEPYYISDNYNNGNFGWQLWSTSGFSFPCLIVCTFMLHLIGFQLAHTKNFGGYIFHVFPCQSVELFMISYSVKTTVYSKFTTNVSKTWMSKTK